LGLEIIDQSLAAIPALTFSTDVAIDDHPTKAKLLLNRILFLWLEIS